MSYQNHLYVWEDRFLYITAGVASELTQRHTVTLLVALDPTGFTLGEPSGKQQRYQAALIARQAHRSLDSSQTSLLSMNFDPQSYEYHTLSRFLGNQSVRPVILQPNTINPGELHQIGQGTLAVDRLFRLTTTLPLGISGYKPVGVNIDIRAVHIAQKVKKELPLSSSVAELAAGVGLSGDRLSHLFSEQLGLSIKSYILWARMRRAVGLIARGESLAAVAYDVGFSDSAHLTRTIKQFFGLTPSYIVKAIKVHML